MNFEDYETLPTQNFVTHMTAGAIAGVMEHCIMYPLDSVKTRMQSLRTAHNRTITETFRHMVQREGLLRPIRGMGAVVMGAGPAHACFFATYEQSKHMLSHLTRHRHDHITHGLSGCLASLIHDAVSNPAEVVKQRLQMLNSPYRGVWECARHVYRAEGLRAFYRSYGTQVAMNVPFQALHFVTYEWCQSVLNPLRVYDPLTHATAGAAAGALAAAATTPLDVCKTVLNTQEGAARAESMRQAARHVVTATGAGGFFKGVQARVLYQMPAAAICWLTYETLKHALITLLVSRATASPADLLSGLVADSQSNKLPSWVRITRCTAGVSHTMPSLPSPPPSTVEEPLQEQPADYAALNDENEIDGESDVDSNPEPVTEPTKPYNAPSSPAVPDHYLDDE